MVPRNEGLLSPQKIVAEHVSSHLGENLVTFDTNLFKSEDDSTTVVCLWSKVYGESPSERYWFGFNPRQSDMLAQTNRAYVALGCGPEPLVFLVPYRIFSQWADGMDVTIVRGRVKHRHVRIAQSNDGYLLRMPGDMENIPLNEYKIALLSASNAIDQRIRYRDFGDAPNDDPRELQNFAKRVRRGQKTFRDNLLRAYGSRCSITGEGPEEVLEAVHIVPHSVTGINELDNGLLMRADLHCLFDDGLLLINPRTMDVELDNTLRQTSYWQFNGSKLKVRVHGPQLSGKFLQERLHTTKGPIGR